MRRLLLLACLCLVCVAWVAGCMRDPTYPPAATQRPRLVKPGGT